MRTVVTGVDQDQHARSVLHRALAEARTTGRPLQAVHAWCTPTWAPGAVGLDDVEGERAGTARAQQAAADLLGEALREAVDDRPVPTTAVGLHGDAGALLVRATADAGLVVVGRRSRGVLLSALLGSATGHVLHLASCPVMVVPRGPAPAFRRVLVGSDAQDSTGSALRWALDAARRHSCPLVVVHALRLTPSPVPVSAQLVDARQEDEVHGRLAAQVAGASAGSGDVVVTVLVRDGAPYDVLLGEARPDDLLVLGSRAYRGLADVLLGEVAVACAQDATGTVVVVRDGQERLDDPPTGALRAHRTVPAVG